MAQAACAFCLLGGGLACVLQSRPGPRQGSQAPSDALLKLLFGVNDGGGQGPAWWRRMEALMAEWIGTARRTPEARPYIPAGIACLSVALALINSGHQRSG